MLDKKTNGQKEAKNKQPYKKGEGRVTCGEPVAIVDEAK